MNSPLLQLLVLAGIAVFLILRLRSVLGTREGFEKPELPAERRARPGPDLAVIEGGPDRDITDHVEDGTPTAKALADMKRADPSFAVGDFLQGARGAYEMILMAFERGDLSEVRDFLDPDVAEAFQSVIDQRADQGLTVEATFVGLGDVSLEEATFDDATREGEVAVRFVAELTSVVRDMEGDVVEGDPTAIRKQVDTWTFARRMGADDPNWLLVSTG
ncbi:MAG: Tim44/TimA family putative adaptor protein [Paracoccaceae bacterium]